MYYDIDMEIMIIDPSKFDGIIYVTKENKDKMLN